MADPYYRYSVPADRGNIERSSFPTHLPSEMPLDIGVRAPQAHQSTVNPPYAGAYDLDSFTGTSTNGYSGASEGPSLISHGSDVALAVSKQSPSVPTFINEGSSSIRNIEGLPMTNVDGLPETSRESNVLFIDGLPTDCTRREVGHLFRQFYGYKDIRVVHKVPRKKGDKALALCFVEFRDSKSALTALQALQGYRLQQPSFEDTAVEVGAYEREQQLP